ncbi:MAG: TIGR03085 family metal-binding protein [Actinomycetes bacterium]
MSTPNWAQHERKAIADEFALVGPDAPTLCGDWTTRDLAAHLIVRETRPDAAVGIVVKRLAGWGERVQDGVAKRPWPKLIEQVRNGPPLLSAFSLPGVDRAANTAEYFVHHEDVRRAGRDWDGNTRTLDPMFSETLWTMLNSRGALLFRRAPVGVLLKRSDGRGGQVSVHPGSDRVTIVGPAQEILLYAFGRKDHAHVRIDGSPKALDTFTSADLSL